MAHITFASKAQRACLTHVTVVHMSTGVTYSDDKLLQTRVFSYADTQRHRLGPNYLLLPVNAPKCDHHNNHHDGFMNFMHRDEEVNYFPSRYDKYRYCVYCLYCILICPYHKGESTSTLPMQGHCPGSGCMYFALLCLMVWHWLRRCCAYIHILHTTHRSLYLILAQV